MDGSGSAPASGAPDQDRTGSLVGGKYKVQRLLGTGGMGSVYEARNTWTKRRVAIKFLRPDLSVTRESVLRFMQEAQAAASIAHPNIVEVLDMGREAADGALYIVQEFLSGQTLRQRIGKAGSGEPTGISAYEAVDIALPIMGALCAAHRRGIVHRDIKPENIFLTTGPGGERIPKLIDFGVSKVHGSTALADQTVPGSFVGTPRYMSPEQLRGDRAIDGRADAWSMAVVLYEMLSGSCPYQADTLFNLVSAILKGKPATLDQLVPGCPPAFAELISRALDSRLEVRHPDLRSFIDDLLACPGIEAPGKATLAERHRAALNPVNADDGSSGQEEPAPLPSELFTPMVTPAGPPPGSAATFSSGMSMNGELRMAPAAEPAAGSRRWMVVTGIAALALVAGGLGAHSFWPSTVPPRAAAVAGGSVARGVAPAAPAPAPAPVSVPAPSATQVAAPVPPAPTAAAPPADAGAPAAASPADAGVAAADARGAAADARGAAADARGAEPSAVKKPAARPRATPRRGRPRASEKRPFGDTYVLDPD